MNILYHDVCIQLYHVLLLPQVDSGVLELFVSVYDRDIGSDGINDLIDQFIISIDVLIGSSFIQNYTGHSSHAALELGIKVVCGINNCQINCNYGCCDDDNTTCKCIRGIGGPLCDKIVDCMIYDDICRNGNCVENPDSNNEYRCDCYPGYSGTLCENNIDNCAGIVCSGKGQCLDGNETFSCVCEPGHTGDFCESETGVYLLYNFTIVPGACECSTHNLLVLYTYHTNMHFIAIALCMQTQSH